MGPSIDDSYRFLAACYLREQVKQLATELVGVRESIDIEHVHQARVASRRLRAALGLFDDCLPETMVQPWRKAIRRITTELGTARDCDVHALELTDQLVDLKKRAACRAVARLLVDIERRREACQSTVLQEIDLIERGGALEEILHMAKETLVDVDKLYRRKLKHLEPQDVAYTPLVFARVGEKMKEQLADLKSYEDSLASRKDKKRHHQMRIAAKRLRYTMEIVQPIYHGRLDKSLAIVRRLQGILGDIHDCDVWCVKLKEFKCSEREQITESYGNPAAFDELGKGFDYLRGQCKARRRKLFDELVEFWEKLEKKGRWDAFLDVINRKPRRKTKHKGEEQPGARNGQPQLCDSGRGCHLCKRRNTCKKLRNAVDSGLMPVSILGDNPPQNAEKNTTVKKMTANKPRPQKKRIKTKKSADSHRSRTGSEGDNGER